MQMDALAQRLDENSAFSRLYNVGLSCPMSRYDKISSAEEKPRPVWVHVGVVRELEHTSAVFVRKCGEIVFRSE